MFYRANQSPIAPILLESTVTDLLETEANASLNGGEPCVRTAREDVVKVVHGIHGEGGRHIKLHAAPDIQATMRAAGVEPVRTPAEVEERTHWR